MLSFFCLLVSNAGFSLNLIPGSLITVPSAIALTLGIWNPLNPLVPTQVINGEEINNTLLESMGSNSESNLYQFKRLLKTIQESPKDDVFGTFALISKGRNLGNVGFYVSPPSQFLEPGLFQDVIGAIPSDLTSYQVYFVDPVTYTDLGKGYLLQSFVNKWNPETRSNLKEMQFNLSAFYRPDLDAQSRTYYLGQPFFAKDEIANASAIGGAVGTVLGIFMMVSEKGKKSNQATE